MLNICIVCSVTSSRDVCERIVELFGSNADVAIYHPFLNQSGSLYEIQKRYLQKIEAADLIIAIPKTSYTDENCEASDEYTRLNSYFGESTSYEIAFAQHIGKPVVLWGWGSFLTVDNQSKGKRKC